MSRQATLAAQAATLNQRGVDIARYGSVTDPEDNAQPQYSIGSWLLSLLIGCGPIIDANLKTGGNIEATAAAKKTDPGDGSGTDPQGDGDDNDTGDGDDGGGEGGETEGGDGETDD